MSAIRGYKGKLKWGSEKTALPADSLSIAMTVPVIHFYYISLYSAIPLRPDLPDALLTHHTTPLESLKTSCLAGACWMSFNYSMSRKL
jgi:hypothetical protein